MAASCLAIEPLNGLANRLRALDSALALAREDGRPVVLRWHSDGLDCPFDRLLSPAPEIERVETWRFQGRLDRLRYRAARAARRAAGFCELDNAAFEQVRGSIGVKALLAHRKLSIASSERFWPNPTPFAGFVAAPWVADKAAEMTQDWDGQVVGVHVRRTDQYRSIESSPTAAFEREMAARLAREHDLRFFLATDDPREEDRLAARFPGRILIFPKTERARNEPQAIEEALVDLLCLAASREIIGSYRSSFGEVAAEWGGRPLTVALQVPDGRASSEAAK